MGFTFRLNDAPSDVSKPFTTDKRQVVFSGLNYFAHKNATGYIRDQCSHLQADKSTINFTWTSFVSQTQSPGGRKG